MASCQVKPQDLIATAGDTGLNLPTVQWHVLMPELFLAEKIDHEFSLKPYSKPKNCRIHTAIHCRYCNLSLRLHVVKVWTKFL